ncbi:TPA: hypothetical protein QDB51_002674 [Burkholderia vietnamiensis]|nr:hypothetical protein [Burkholderia vietnamiensis]
MTTKPTLTDEVRQYYNDNRIAFNRECNAHDHMDLLSETHIKNYGEDVIRQVTWQLKRISNLKAEYPEHMHYINEQYIPDLDFVAYNSDRGSEFFNEEGLLVFMHNNKETVIKAASMNTGLLTWMPQRFMVNPEVLLVAAINNRHGLYCLSSYFDIDSFPFVHEDIWDGNCTSEDQKPVIQQLIKVVEFEKPIFDLYEKVREAITACDLDEYLPSAKEVEQVMKDDKARAVFERAIEADCSSSVLKKFFQDLRKQAMAHKLNEDLPTKADNKKKGKI